VTEQLEIEWPSSPPAQKSLGFAHVPRFCLRVELLEGNNSWYLSYFVIQ